MNICICNKFILIRKYWYQYRLSLLAEEAIKKRAVLFHDLYFLHLIDHIAIAWLITRYFDAWERFRILTIFEEIISPNTTKNTIILIKFPLEGSWDDKMATRISIARRSITFSWQPYSPVFQKTGRWSPNKELLRQEPDFQFDWLAMVIFCLCLGDIFWNKVLWL